MADSDSKTIAALQDAEQRFLMEGNLTLNDVGMVLSYSGMLQCRLLIIRKLVAERANTEPNGGATIVVTKEELDKLLCVGIPLPEAAESDARDRTSKPG